MNSFCKVNQKNCKHTLPRSKNISQLQSIAFNLKNLDVEKNKLHHLENMQRTNPKPFRKNNQEKYQNIEIVLSQTPPTNKIDNFNIYQVRKTVNKSQNKHLIEVSQQSNLRVSDKERPHTRHDFRRSESREIDKEENQCKQRPQTAKSNRNKHNPIDYCNALSIAKQEELDNNHFEFIRISKLPKSLGLISDRKSNKVQSTSIDQEFLNLFAT